MKEPTRQLEPRIPRQLTDAERQAVANLLFNLWLNTEFRYDRLTDRDKHAVDPETFRTLAIFARDPVRARDANDSPHR